MASHHDEDTMPEETQGYKLSQPKQSMAEYQQMGESPDIDLFHHTATPIKVHNRISSIRISSPSATKAHES